MAPPKIFALPPLPPASIRAAPAPTPPQLQQCPQQLLSPKLRVPRPALPEVLQVMPDIVFHLHTTRSTEFLGLLSLAYQPAICGLEAASHDLNTGVWPNLPSPTARWKRVCEASVDFPPNACGRKLVGVRSFSRGLHVANGGDGPAGTKRVFRSARDRDGHETHGGGRGDGKREPARESSIDAAVADGVGVRSLSLSSGATPYFRDTVAVGAFGAAADDMFVSCSTCNSSPFDTTVSNSAPWVATVGTGTLDRDFPAYVTLPTSTRLAGVSLYAGPSPPRPAMLPLVYGSDNANVSNLCLSGTLDPATRWTKKLLQAIWDGERIRRFACPREVVLVLRGALWALLDAKQCRPLCILHLRRVIREPLDIA
jgi:hypothetical protein